MTANRSAYPAYRLETPLRLERSVQPTGTTTHASYHSRFAHTRPDRARRRRAAPRLGTGGVATGCGVSSKARTQLANTYRGVHRVCRCPVRVPQWLRATCSTATDPAYCDTRPTRSPAPATCCRIRSGASRCLLYTSDAADDLLCVDLGGR